MTSIRHSAAGAALAVLALALAPAGAQAKPTFDVTLKGADISGAWGHVFAFATSGEKLDPRLTPPPPPAAPFKLEFKAQYGARVAAEKAANARGEPLAGTSVACLPDGMPGMMFAIYPLEILQTPGRITIVEEAYSQVRRIWLDKPAPAADSVAPGFFGYSVGHWDGDTLKVDTVGVKDVVEVFKGVKHSDQLAIHEAIKLVAPDILQDEITVTDPAVLTGPWSFTYAYRRLPGYEMLEYVCEDNREYVDDKGQTKLRLGD